MHLKSFVDVLQQGQDWISGHIARQTVCETDGSSPSLPFSVSVADLSRAIEQSMRQAPGLTGCSLSPSGSADPAATFGVTEARKLRGAGMTLDSSLRLMKHYRQAYRAYLDFVNPDPLIKSEAGRFLECCFDRMETGLSGAYIQEVGERKQVEQELRLCQYVVNKTIDQTFWITKDGTFSFVNEAACKTLGYRREELLGKTIDTIDPVFPAKKWQPQWQTMKRKRSGRLESWHRAKNGRMYPVEIRAHYVVLDGREYICAFVTDISERKRSEEELRRTNEMFSAVIEAAPLPITAIDPDGKVLMWNPAAEKVFGWREEEVLHRYLPIVSEEHLTEFSEKNRQAFSGEATTGLCVERQCKDGRRLDMQLFHAPLHDPQDDIYAVMGILMDVTEQNKAQEQIYYLAHHDQLTGLANRALLPERFEQAISNARRNGTRLALCTLDLDGFKRINDLLGHQQGDQLLRQVAERLQHCIRESDTICRLGGDEFLLLFNDIRETKALSSLIQKVSDVFSKPFSLGSHQQPVTMSMGVTVFPEDGADFDTLFKNADAALYFAKDCGRNNIQFFREEIADQIQRRLTIETGLRKALAKQELSVHYQPICRVADDRIVGAEALIRWFHPQQGWMSPGEFISVAEESNLIIPLGEWVLEKVCRTIRDWDARGMPPLPVAVNVSAVQIFHEEFPRFVTRTLQRFGVDPRRLELEVTESLFLKNLSSVESVMQQLKTIGVSLSLDDFGTGYSSLSYLKRFKIDKLKIDRSFVADICHDEQDAVLTDTIIMLSKNLGMQSVAEGVESREQLTFLRNCQCDYYQGYLCSRPVAADNFVELVECTPKAS